MPQKSSRHGVGKKMSLAKTQSAQKLTADSRRFTQIGFRRFHRRDAEYAAKPAGSRQMAAGSNSDYGLQDSKQ